MWHHFNYEAAAEMRRKYVPVEKVLKVMAPEDGDVVMDIGGGDGHYSLLFSEHCGKVIYVDPSSQAVELTRKKASDSGGKVEIVQEDICSMAVPEIVNKVFFSNSFHDIPCRDELIEKFSRNDKGRIRFVLIEFRKDSDIGPPQFIRIGPEQLDEIFQRHGYRVLKRELLEKHYITMYGT